AGVELCLYRTACTTGQTLHDLLFCHDESACPTHAYWPEPAHCASDTGLARAVLCGISHTRGGHRSILAFCGHCMDFSLSAALSRGVDNYGNSHSAACLLQRVCDPVRIASPDVGPLLSAPGPSPERGGGTDYCHQQSRAGSPLLHARAL